MDDKYEACACCAAEGEPSNPLHDVLEQLSAKHYSAVQRIKWCHICCARYKPAECGTCGVYLDDHYRDSRAATHPAMPEHVFCDDDCCEKAFRDEQARRETDQCAP
jgi:hypothetical protein